MRTASANGQRSWVKWVGALVAAAILGASAPALGQASPFADVPPGHWAYGALEQLGAAGLLDEYSPGFFTGSRRLTRYEVALSVAHALERLSEPAPLDFHLAGEVELQDLFGRYNRAHPQRALSPSETAALQSVVAEFQAELKMLGYGVRSSAPERVREDGLRLDPSLDRIRSAWTSWGMSRQSVVVWREDDARASGAAAFRWSLLPAERLSGWPNGSLGPTGDTYLLAETPSGLGATVSAWQRRPFDNLDGSLSLSDFLLPGSRMLGRYRESGSSDAHLPKLAGTQAVETVVQLTPQLSVQGERARRVGLDGEAEATAVGASVQLGDVALAGRVRSVDPGFDPGGLADSGGEAVGIGLTVPLGDVFLTTERDVVQRPDNAVEHVTSWSLEYNVPQLAQVRAQWQSVTLADLRHRSRTSVDVNVPVPQGALRLGVAYEDDPDPSPEAGISVTTLTMAGIDVRLLDNAEARAEISVEDGGDGRLRTTSLGLRYTLGPEAALLLGYKLIDFADLGRDRHNVTTAEFTIRF
ncbi:MAG: hypothetical protein H0Z37_08835 [Firmicutes bacterium]|nr:hypothetical protein [Bacillota bacterium]